MQDAQRRALIFSVLDDMKSNNVKITAQKLATQAKMGKQTVLPYYREWQELEVLGESEEVELSQEFLRVLKREIAKEKFHQGEQLLVLQDQLDDERETYTAQSELWHQQQDALQTELGSQNEKNQALSEQNQQLQTLENELRQKLNALTEREQGLQREVEKLEQRLQMEGERSEKALAEQERRLDESHAKIVDHWLKVLDEERREKTRLHKQYEKLEQERTVLAKDNARSEELYNQERKTSQQALAQLADAEQKLAALQERQPALEQDLKQQQAIVDQVSAMLDQPEDLFAVIKQLQEQANALVSRENELIQLQDKSREMTAMMEAMGKENRLLSEQAIRLEAKLEGIQFATSIKSQ